MGTRRKWTRDKLDVIERLFSEGLNSEEIAKQMGITTNYLYFLCHYYKLGKSDKGVVKRLKEKQLSLAERIQILKGEKPRTETPSHFFSDEQIDSWLWEKHKIEGCKKFCQDVLGVTLQDYQIKMVEAMQTKPRCLFCLGRQSGKDFVISVFSVWRGICNSNEKFLLISPAQRQSTLLFERIMMFIANSLELFDSVSKSNMECLEFTNSSKIYNLPSTSFIRGFTEVSGAFLNEVAHGLDEEVFASTEPMLAIKNGFLHQFSTPTGCIGKFWENYNNPVYFKLKPMLPSKFGLPSTVNKYLSKEWLELQKKTLSTIQYDCEINANFSEAINNFFPSKMIDRISREYDFINFPQENLVYYLGIDIGRMKDWTVLTVISEDSEKNLKVSLIKPMRKPFSEQIQEIIKLHEKFRFRKIVIEYAGLSMPMCEKLSELDLPIDFFVPTTDNKEEAYNFLLRTMEQDKLILPKHSQLQYELRSFQYEVSSRGQLLLHHVSGGSDDYVDSLMFSVWASKTIEWRPLSEEFLKKWEEFIG